MSATDGAKPTLLVVDDDTEIVALLERYFTAREFRVLGAGDGAQMRRVIAAESVDLVLLDLGLPGEDGLELTRFLREQWRGPVIIVSGRGDSVDRVVGLELGADDYVSKPFDLRELLARVRSVLRRATPATPPPTAPAPATAPADDAEPAIEFDGYRYDTRARTLTAPDGSRVALTSAEFELLGEFLARPGHVLSRDHLMNRLHGRDAGPFDRAIDAQIGRLRKKIEADPAAPERIKSVRGAGYVFSARVKRT